MEETKHSDLTVSSFCIQNIFFACKAFSIIFDFSLKKSKGINNYAVPLVLN